MALLTDNFNLNQQLSVQVIDVYVCVESEMENPSEVENNTDKKKMSMEEKRKLFYENKLENITKCFKFLNTY